MPFSRRKRTDKGRDPFEHLADERHEAETSEPWFLAEDDGPQLDVQTGVSSNLSTAGLGYDDVDPGEPVPDGADPADEADADDVRPAGPHHGDAGPGEPVHDHADRAGLRHDGVDVADLRHDGVDPADEADADEADAADV